MMKATWRSMGKITELFGLNCADAEADFQTALEKQLCPFSRKTCTKMRKSSPDIKIGTCAVKYQGNDVMA